MSGVWRILDTGLRSAAENLALDRALLEARQAGESPNTLRFLRFEPSALVGYHQDVVRELHLEYCAAHGIAVQRRITGGGAIYFDPAQLGWELFLDRRALGSAEMENIAARICNAAADGLRALGVDARFRPRNDIEVNGRKISGTGGVFEGEALMYQGTLLIDFDVERMLRVLRIPAEKLTHKAIASARERVANLRELLSVVPPLDTIKQALATAFAEAFAVRFEVAALNAAEQRRYAHALAEIESDDWVYQPGRVYPAQASLSGMHHCDGGLIYANVIFESRSRLLRQVWFHGDFFLAPRRLVADMEAALRNAPLAELRANLCACFARQPVDGIGLGPEDFAAAVEDAVANVGTEAEPVD